MAYVSIFNDESNTYFRVNFDIKNSIISNDAETTGSYEACLIITTTLKYPDGKSFPTFLIRTLDDVPPGVVIPATNFTDLCKMYINYFLSESTVGQSSSSSSSNSSSSKSNSSSSNTSSSSILVSRSSNSSSSVLVSRSSHSSTSSIEQYSTSSAQLLL